MAEARAVEGDDAEMAFAGGLVETGALGAAAGPAVEEEDWCAVGVAVFAPCDAAVEGGEDAEAAVGVVGDWWLALHVLGRRGITASAAFCRGVFSLRRRGLFSSSLVSRREGRSIRRWRRRVRR